MMNRSIVIACLLILPSCGRLNSGVGNSVIVESKASYNPVLQHEVKLQPGRVSRVSDRRYLISMANYDLAANRAPSSVEDIRITLVVDGTSSLDPGVYACTDSGERRVSAQFQTRGGSVILSGRDAGTMEIQRVDGQDVIGRVRLDDGTTSIYGSFTARLSLVSNP